ncbi:hypothetical protein VFPPC_18067 [Pochonia chlamydosporia 170]|uniref:Uncharacterized protein n=1 Tax=Pochonia chlamydosporia 170 TaxID=1380566 RepID=A0A219AQF8_METCM|nr:hypothetical protein VFPPC_18067 [Pochonia chlamydosporia 170]OWT42812.1 hypothetical protein VFPPC_18067 [Pochonia chlamydosporia 170]
MPHFGRDATLSWASATPHRPAICTRAVGLDQSCTGASDGIRVCFEDQGFKARGKTGLRRNLRPQSSLFGVWGPSSSQQTINGTETIVLRWGFVSSIWDSKKSHAVSVESSENIAPSLHFINDHAVSVLATILFLSHSRRLSHALRPNLFDLCCVSCVIAPRIRVPDSESSLMYR